MEQEHKGIVMKRKYKSLPEILIRRYSQKVLEPLRFIAKLQTPARSVVFLFLILTCNGNRKTNFSKAS